MNNPLLPFGAFGENFTVSGLTEADVCIGDTWQVGGNPAALRQLANDAHSPDQQAGV